MSSASQTGRVESLLRWVWCLYKTPPCNRPLLKCNCLQLHGELQFCTSPPSITCSPAPVAQESTEPTWSPPHNYQALPRSQWQPCLVWFTSVSQELNSYFSRPQSKVNRNKAFIFWILDKVIRAALIVKVSDTMRWDDTGPWAEARPRLGAGVGQKVGLPQTNDLISSLQHGVHQIIVITTIRHHIYNHSYPYPPP